MDHSGHLDLLLDYVLENKWPRKGAKDHAAPGTVFGVTLKGEKPTTACQDLAGPAAGRKVPHGDMVRAERVCGLGRGRHTVREHRVTQAGPAEGDLGTGHISRLPFSCSLSSFL